MKINTKVHFPCPVNPYGFYPWLFFKDLFCMFREFIKITIRVHESFRILMTLRIAVLAPMLQEAQYQADYTVKLKSNMRELTLEAMYQFLLNHFDEVSMPWELKHEDDIPAAGFYLASLLKSKGYDVTLGSHYDEASLQKMADFSPDVICLSTTMLVSIGALRKVVDGIRRYMPGVFIIAGGVFVWKNHLSSLTRYSQNTKDIYDYGLFNQKGRELSIDAFVAAPHGAEALLAILKELEKGRRRDLACISNLILPVPGKGYMQTARKEEPVDYNEDITQWEFIDEMPSRIPLRTSVGCPFRCSFCDFCTLYPKMHMRSAESLSRELSMINQRLKNRVSVIHVSDDNVFINPKRLQEVCGVFERRGVSGWIAFMRASSVNKGNIDLVKRSGLLMSILGVESGDENQLRRMRKHMDIRVQKKGIELLDAHGISVLMSFVVGFPGETRETIHNTIRFLNSLELQQAITSYHMYPLYLFPLSELGDPEFREKWQLRGSAGKWKHATMDSDQAMDFAYNIYSNVPDLPYHYYDESNFFNLSMFSLEERTELFRIRNRMARQLMENRPGHAVAGSFREIAAIMGFDPEMVPDGIAEKFYVKEGG